ncbi:hypothetical protein [Rhodococcus kronopolitis]|uniref:Uncharacterized protein n=1 Tax=Rhodococcus kronopolitis TaxID=1460226 RepID=A0ABV9FV05_9NOCA
MEKTYSVSLVSQDSGRLSVEWASASQGLGEYSCHLAVVDHEARISRTAAIARGDAGVVLLLEEERLDAGEGHANQDLSVEAEGLLAGLIRAAGDTYRGFNRLEVNEMPAEWGSTDLRAVLDGDLSPGVIVLVSDNASVSDRLSQVAVGLGGHAIAFRVTRERAESLLCGGLGIGGDVRDGSVVSLARSTAAGRVDIEVVGAFSLRRQPRGARRLVLRHQLAAPRPMWLEKLRTSSLLKLRGHADGGDVTAAEELLEEESRRASDLEQRLRALELDLEIALAEQDAALRELHSAQARNKYLERAQRDVSGYVVDDGTDETWSPDTCFDAVLAARDDLKYLVVSCLDDPAIDLDRHPRHGLWATKIWGALKALNDYVRAKVEMGYRGSLHSYQSDPPEAVFPLSCDYAAKESESTSNDRDMRRVRTFRVPHEVSSDGQYYMEAHLKIDRALAAPRVHLYDDSGGPTQRLYVGYVGPHLPTSGGH